MSITILTDYQQRHRHQTTFLKHAGDSNAVTDRWDGPSQPSPRHRALLASTHSVIIVRAKLTRDARMSLWKLSISASMSVWPSGTGNSIRAGSGADLAPFGAKLAGK
jgi:hypothetical protein